MSSPKSGRAIVVGGGLSGLTTACELLEQGCNVTILEKGENLGGNSSKATCGIAAPNCFMHAQSGIKDDPASLVTDQASKDLVEKGPRDVEWLAMALGIRDELTLRLTPGHNAPRTIGTKTHFPGAVITYAAIHLLQQVSSVKPDRLEIISSARATKLVTEGRKVVGVQYAKDGTSKTLRGVVVLASGGFAGDPEALKKYAPQLASLPTTNDDRASGDAITLGTAVGANVERLDQVKVIPTGAVLPGQEDSQFKVVVSDAICGAGGKMLNVAGQRFCNELGTAQERSDAMAKTQGPFRLAIGAQQAQQVTWLVDFYTKRNIMKKYRNAAALAQEMKIQPVVLNNAGLGIGEVYAAVVTPVLNSCSGGLTVGPGYHAPVAGRVMARDGKPIDGLYAAGEATCALSSRLWSVSGIPLLYCVYSGRIAGRAAAGALPGMKKTEDLRQLVISTLTAPSKVAEDKEASPAGTASPNGAAEKPVEELTKEELIAKVKDLLANGVSAANGASDGPKGVPMDEVKKHNTKTDAWIVVNGAVLDVTKWIPIHPGGEQAIVAYLGQDATDEWNMIHKPGTIEKYLVEPGGNGAVKIGDLGGAVAAGGGGGAAAPSGLTFDEVGKHNKESDLWCVVNGIAYDVTKWTQVHPGGVQAIVAYAGKDATDEWNCIHKPGTIEKNLFPGNPNGPVDKGPVSGAQVTAVKDVVVDDDEPPPDGPGCMPGPIGAILYLAKAIAVMLLKTVFFTGNLKFTLDNNRKGTMRSACFLLLFTIIHVLGNFVGMVKGPEEANGEGYFFDRILWTGGLGIWPTAPLSVVEEYLALALLLHIAVALKRSWDISMNYTIVSGRWNMLLSGLTILLFLTVHLTDIRLNDDLQHTMLRPPKYFISFDGLLEGRVFYETDPSIPLVRVRDIYSRQVELFKRLPHALFYTACITIFWIHMCLGWKKLVPADAMQIPKDHVSTVTMLGYVAATAIVSMYVSVVWYTYVAEPIKIVHVP